MLTKKNALKKVTALLLIAVMSAALAGCGGSGPAEEYEGAITHVSGTVMIYTSMFEDIIEMMIPVMERVFPNVDVQFFYGGTGMIQARIASEIVAGQLGADMLMVADPSYAIELQAAGMLHAFETPHRPYMAFDYCPQGTWYPVRISNMVLAYNPEMYSIDEIPTSMFDFAFDPRVSGAISKANPLTSGTALVSIVALYGAYGEDYFAGLGSQNVMVESGAVARTKLMTGECMVIMILEESILQAREVDGSELTVIYPDDGTIVIP
ncbi:MAG: ABC transporter substrate-binding protein, partial [Defluviitaleaceae bacterium]|nr:ABC transporter substrate-binding protein [Defluviitaleaceae bacterium]